MIESYPKRGRGELLGLAYVPCRFGFKAGCCFSIDCIWSQNTSLSSIWFNNEMFDNVYFHLNL